MQLPVIHYYAWAVGAALLSSVGSLCSTSSVVYCNDEQSRIAARSADSKAVVPALKLQLDH